MNNPTIRRHRPVRPVRPTERVKQATSAEALAFLNEFVREARKEIRKREQLTLKGNVSKTDCDSVSFIFDNFSLTINFKEGMQL